MQGKLLILLLILVATPTFAKSPSDWSLYQKHGTTSPKWDALIEAGFDAFDGANTETAISFFKRALSLGCQDGLVFYKLALVIESGGNLKGTLETLQKAAPLLQKNYPNHPATFTLSEHLGNIYYELGRYDEALPKFLEAIEKQGDNFLRNYLVGQILRMGQRQKEAIPYFEKGLGFPPPKEAPNMKLLAELELVKLYFDTNDLDKALAMANAILKDDPTNAVAISYRDTINHKRAKEKERKTMDKFLEHY